MLARLPPFEEKFPPIPERDLARCLEALEEAIAVVIARSTYDLAAQPRDPERFSSSLMRRRDLAVGFVGVMGEHEKIRAVGGG